MLFILSIIPQINLSIFSERRARGCLVWKYNLRMSIPIFYRHAYLTQLPNQILRTSFLNTAQMYCTMVEKLRMVLFRFICRNSSHQRSTYPRSMALSPLVPFRFRDLDLDLFSYPHPTGLGASSSFWNI